MEIKIKIPDEYFKNIPELIDYTNNSFGKMEKTRRLLARSISSAIDNNENLKEINKIRAELTKISNNKWNLYEKERSLKQDILALKGACRLIKCNDNGKLRIKLNEVNKELEEIKMKIKELELKRCELKNKLPKGVVFWWV